MLRVFLFVFFHYCYYYDFHLKCEHTEKKWRLIPNGMLVIVLVKSQGNTLRPFCTVCIRSIHSILRHGVKSSNMHVICSSSQEHNQSNDVNQTRKRLLQQTANPKKKQQHLSLCMRLNSCTCHIFRCENCAERKIFSLPIEYKSISIRCM